MYVLDSFINLLEVLYWSVVVGPWIFAWQEGGGVPWGVAEYQNALL